MHKLYTDGGARGNPGPAGLGIAIMTNEQIIAEIGVYIGEATNNDAEYKALILGLEECIKRDLLEVECFLDSQLVVKQLNGEYKVKNPKMRDYFNQIKLFEKKFTSISYTHIPREENSVADSLVNKVLDETLGA